MAHRRVLAVSAVGLGLVWAVARGQGDLSVYQKAFQYAQAPDGPNQFKTDAMKFAEEMSARPDGARALEVYQGAYKYATTPDGPNLFRADAMKLADRMAKRRDGARVLEAYQKAYKFAASPTGPNLFKTDAMKFAEDKSGLNGPEAAPTPPVNPAPKLRPNRTESMKLMADLSKTLADGQKEADAILEAIPSATDADRAALDRRLTALVGRLEAKLAEVKRNSLAPPGK